LSREARTEISLSHLLKTIVEIYDVTDRGKKVAVTLNDALPPGIRVMGNDERLGQVFRNLIDNAISFSPEGSSIAITARLNHEFARIMVEDNGPGIPSDNLESIFERFYTERPGDTFGKNSGLGLSIARQISQNAGGRIWAENRPTNAPGKASGGARFIVELPLAGQQT
jgi:two-component system sensor histidine kinase ChvG